MDLSLARYFLKWSWLSSTASSRSFLFLSGIACACRWFFFLSSEPSVEHITETREQRNKKTVEEERLPVTADKDFFNGTRVSGKASFNRVLKISTRQEIKN